MNSRRRLFFSILGVMRRRLWAARAISLFYAILPAAAIALLTWVVISRWIIIVHLDIKMIVTSGMAVLVWLAAIWYRRPSWTDAARSFDKHGLDDRVTTALGFLDDDSSMAELQRDDTLNAMRHALPGVKRKKIRWFYRKRAACALVLFGAVWLGLAFPNDVMKQAAQAEQEQRIVEKKKEAVSEFVDQQKGEVRPKAKKEL
ncbi:MAG TPA: hypothetical protein VFJ73_00265, partial [Bacillales bacterium]|nr:hypothetical protein [Bacillales bacterium]